MNINPKDYDIVITGYAEQGNDLYVSIQHYKTKETFEGRISKLSRSADSGDEKRVVRLLKGYGFYTAKVGSGDETLVYNNAGQLQGKLVNETKWHYIVEF